MTLPLIILASASLNVAIFYKIPMLAVIAGIVFAVVIYKSM